MQLDTNIQSKKGLERRWAIFREQKREERFSMDICYVINIVHGTAHPCGINDFLVLEGGCGHPRPPTGKGGTCCTVHGLTRRIHNVQPNLQAPILSAACVD
ncbi:Hypothetical predicted protein [Lynx pardinus]|uniref:Uncharacterized protein n=1 Tax=Lynx pardinus TaxID=191816 RepID=A0A485MG30_LYNPA|nr:Hypothetical predicted protein [Lynx pardinus]